MKNSIRTAVTAAAALLLLLTVAASFTSCAKSTVSEDVHVLAEALEARGYTCSYYENEHFLLSSIEADMRSEMSDPPQKAPRAFLFAIDASGKTALEVYIFENEQDARRLFKHFDGGEQFVPGESAVKRSGKVVCMGYLDALEIVENAS